jgi:hypothetical protein
MLPLFIRLRLNATEQIWMTASFSQLYYLAGLAKKKTQNLNLYRASNVQRA